MTGAEFHLATASSPRRTAIAALCRVFGGERAHDLDGFDADAGDDVAGDIADEADDVPFIIGVVGVAGDAAGRRGDSVLIWCWSMTQLKALR